MNLVLKFSLSETSYQPTPEQVTLRTTITSPYVNLEIWEILKNAISNRPDLKILERFEPGLSTLNEEKQLRQCSCDVNSSIGFHQRGTEAFTREELISIGRLIQNELEKCLGYAVLEIT